MDCSVANKGEEKNSLDDVSQKVDEESGGGGLNHDDDKNREHDDNVEKLNVVNDINKSNNNDINENTNENTKGETNDTASEGQNGISTNDETTSEKPLSKKQLKKRKRLEKLMAVKKRKKEQKKEARAAKAKAEGRDLDEERRIQAERTKLGVGHKKRELEWQKRFGASAETSFQVCIDCSYEASMTTKEIGSLSNQIRYCYSANKKSSHPLHLSVSSLVGQTYENLSRVEGFPDNWKERGFQCSQRSLTEMHIQKERIVYLTSDSETVLNDLDDSKIYVIGGIVDRNRLKRAAINKANELGVDTARLPIDEHLKLCATKVLTCNHVFEILQKYKDHKDWKKALLEVLPARKDAK